MIPRSLNGETRLYGLQSSLKGIHNYGRNPGTETSKYPEEEKETFDSVSSGERTRKSPNRDACIAGFGLHKGFSNGGRENGFGTAAREGEKPRIEAELTGRIQPLTGHGKNPGGRAETSRKS